MKENLERREREVLALRREAEERENEIERLRSETKQLNMRLQNTTEAANLRQERDAAEAERLKAEVRELREELSEVAMSEYEGVEAGRSLRSYQKSECASDCAEDIEIQRLNGEIPDLHRCSDADRLQKEMEKNRKEFERERVTWAQEKEKVLRYQRQLQLNYVQMFRRSRALETEVESLTLELELCTKNGAKKMPSMELAQTVEL